MSDHHRMSTQFIKDSEIIFSSHSLFINASTKEFTLVNKDIPSYDIALERTTMQQYGCQCLLKF